MRLANAPASWGVFYPTGNRVTPDEYLSALAVAGYSDTELGPFGWMPTAPEALRQLLSRHDLGLCGAAHVHTLADPGSEALLLDTLDRIAALVAPLGARQIVLMDESEFYPKAAMGQVDDTTFAAAMRMIETARRRMEAEGITLAFHPHVGTMIEREDQIDRLLEATGISLCFDTGHHAFWDQDPLAYMDKVRDRISYMHLKNVDPAVRARVLAGALSIDESFAAGVMSPLSRGAVDIRAVMRKLTGWGFAGPVVVEQDPSEQPVPTPAELAAENARFLAVRP